MAFLSYATTNTFFAFSISYCRCRARRRII